VADPLTGPPAPFSAGHGEPFRFVVEEGKVHEFARATRSRCSEHLRALDPVAPLSVLHGEQEYVFRHGPLQAGDELTARQFVDRTYEKQGRRGGSMEFTEVVTRFWRDREDDPVADMRSVSIRVATPPAASDAVGASTSDDTAPENGDVPLTVTDFVRYQGASGDFNPIHHDPDFARAAGYSGPFAVGMLAAGIAANRVSERVGTAAVTRLRVRWQAQAWPGDALGYEVSQSPSEVSVRVLRPDGSVHLTALAVLG
jgi:hydroxyacyl-ACP dehydratase HTD2-like protein with hotdog domain